MTTDKLKKLADWLMMDITESFSDEADVNDVLLYNFRMSNASEAM